MILSPGEEALAEVLARLLGDRALAAGLGGAARGIAETRYGLDAVADRWAELLRRLAVDGPGRGRG